MTKPATDPPEIPVIERVAGGDLTRLLRSESVQRLMHDRVDLVEVKCVKSYIGKAAMRSGVRVIRMSVQPALEDDARTFVLCHELAHHVVGIEQQHCDLWREECAKLVREAGTLNLLSAERVAEGVEMVINGTATRFRGWPEEAREHLKRREERREAQLEELRQDGLAVGSHVVFRYHGKFVEAEVMRVNRVTVSVGPPGSAQTTLRVPLSRVLQVLAD